MRRGSSSIRRATFFIESQLQAHINAEKSSCSHAARANHRKENRVTKPSQINNKTHRAKSRSKPLKSESLQPAGSFYCLQNPSNLWTIWNVFYVWLRSFSFFQVFLSTMLQIERTPEYRASISPFSSEERLFLRLPREESLLLSSWLDSLQWSIDISCQRCGVLFFHRWHLICERCVFSSR